MRWAWRGIYGDNKNAFRILMGKFKVKRLFGKSRPRWEDNIKIHFKGIEEEVFNWINLARTHIENILGQHSHVIRKNRKKLLLVLLLSVLDFAQLKIKVLKYLGLSNRIQEYQIWPSRHNALLFFKAFIMHEENYKAYWFCHEISRFAWKMHRGDLEGTILQWMS